MPTLKGKPKIHIKKRNGKKTQRVYRGGEEVLGKLGLVSARKLFEVRSGEMKTLLGIEGEIKYNPKEHDGFRVLALNKERRKKIAFGSSYLGTATSEEITNEIKVGYFLLLLNENKEEKKTKNFANTELHAAMKGDNLKRALANIRLMIYKMEIEGGGANLEGLEKDIVLIFYALDSRTSGAQTATEAVAALASANTAAATGAVADEENEAEEEGNE